MLWLKNQTMNIKPLSGEEEVVFVLEEVLITCG